MRTRREATERGFALVGVIMFLLVLTILGLSLFSLTGYESQFMQQSMDGVEAFHAAAGGLDRARFALAMRSHLENVKDNLPLDGVIYAVAKRGADSTGWIDWDDGAGPPILIRVKAVKNGTTHMLEAQYSPSRARSLYQRLFSLSGNGEWGVDSVGLRVIPEDPAEPAYQQHNYMGTYLYGECRQNFEDGEPYIFPFGDPPQATLSVVEGGVPEPAVTAFRNANWASATELSLPNGPKNFTLDATGSPDSVRFYRTMSTGGWWSMDIPYERPHYNQWDANITVRGTAIWLFDHGIRAEGTVNVYGSGGRNDLLVIVAEPGSDPGFYNPGDHTNFNQHRSLKGAGIAFLGSISSQIPVILVSSGGVLLENRDFGWGRWEQDDKTSTQVSCLSVFAPYARIMGADCDAGNEGYRLSFARNATDPIDSRINRLSDLGLLPNTAGGLRGKLHFLAGSWREVTETTPP